MMNEFKNIFLIIALLNAIAAVMFLETVLSAGPLDAPQTKSTKIVQLGSTDFMGKAGK